MTVPISKVTRAVDEREAHEEQMQLVQAKMIEALARSESQARWDIRLAATLNLVAIAMDHGGHRDFTDGHARQIRELMALGEAVVAGDPNGVVPSGFGEPTRMQSEEIKKLIMKQAAKIENLTQSTDGELK